MEEDLSDLVECPVSHDVTESQGAEVEVVGEGTLRSEIHHHAEWPKTHTHQLHNPGGDGGDGGGGYVCKTAGLLDHGHEILTVQDTCSLPGVVKVT